MAEKFTGATYHTAERARGAVGARIATFRFEEKPSGQWIGTSPEIKNLLVAERTLPEALAAAGEVLTALASVRQE